MRRISKGLAELALGGMLALYAGGANTAYAQDTSAHSRINGHENGLTELVEKRAQHTAAEIDDITRKISRWLGKAGKWISDTYQEEIFEMRMERMVQLQIENREVDEYLAEKYPPIDASVEVLRFSRDRDSAYVEISYDIHFDDAKIIKQYLVEVEDGLPKKILAEGKNWAERYGNRIGIDELFRIILLNKEFERRWEQEKKDYQRLHPGEILEYQKTNEAFEILAKSIEGYNPGGDDIVIDNNMTRAQIGVKYEIKDEFGNTKDDITSYEIEQYVLTPGGWKFDETIYSSRWKEGILIGTEKNKFQHEDFRKKARDRIKGWLNDIYEYVK